MHRRLLLGSIAGLPLLPSRAGAQAGPKLTGAACAVPRPAGAAKMALLAYRVASTEYVAAAVRSCAGGPLEIEARLVSFPALLEQSNIFLASGGESPYELLHTYNTLMWEQANKDWLLPLDGLLARFGGPLAAGDIPKPIMEASSFGGKLYGLPFQEAVMVLFTNDEMLGKAGAAVPRTTREWLETGAKLKGVAGLRAPLALALGGTAGIATEFHNALMGEGGTWLNADNSPAFRSEQGAAAIELLRGLIALCPGNALSMSNDDVQVAMQQGQVAMTNIWANRAVQMDDPAMSRVRGKVSFHPAPTGGGGVPYSSFTVDMVAIPRGAKAPELAFQTLVDALRPDRARGLAAVTLVPRTSILEDKELTGTMAFVAPAAATLQAGARAAPRVPFFSTLREVVGRALQEGFQGGKPTAEILAAAEANAGRMLKEQGFTKS